MRDGLAVDKWMLVAVALLLALGMTMVLSTSYLYSQERYADGTYFFRKQMISMGVGAVLMIVCSLLPPAFFRRFAYPLLGVTFIILILVLIPGFGAAVRDAAAHGQAGDVVLLSPACSSFDQFQNYAERGKIFKARVQEL